MDADDAQTEEITSPPNSNVTETWVQLIEAIEVNDIYRLRSLLSTQDGRALLNEQIPEEFGITEFSMLHFAAYQGNLTVSKLLVDLGANVNLKDRGGGLAVHSACSRNHVDVAEFFVDINGLEVEDDSGDTPLIRAATSGSMKTFDMLVRRGANVHAKMKDGVTPLMLCSQRGDHAMVERLLKLGVEVDAVNKWGRTALFYGAKGGFLVTLTLLVEVGHAFVNHRDHYGNDASWMAETRGMYECVMYLFDHGAETTAPVKSRGFGAEVCFRRMMLRGDAPTPRSTPFAHSVTQAGKRVVIAGGHGILEGQIQSNNLAGIADDDIASTGANNDLYYFDLDDMVEEFNFVEDQMNDWRRYVLPTASSGRWSTHRCSHLIHIGPDGLTASLVGEMDAACVQADFGFEAKPHMPFFYWELQIVKLGINSAITMGFSAPKYDLNSHPGWEEHSFALHGDDGHIFFNTGQGNIFGPRFGVGDIVGCGVIPQTREIFYTFNGKFVGVAHRNATDLEKHRWYPTLGLTSPGDSGKANFGTFPFMFSFEAPMLKFFRPKLRFLNLSPEGEQDQEATLPKFSIGSFHHLDEAGKELLLVCRNQASWTPACFVINTTDWTVKPTGCAAPNLYSYAFSSLDRERKKLHLVNLEAPVNGEYTIKIYTFDCETWGPVDAATVQFAYNISQLDYSGDSTAAHVVKLINGYLWVWHPLGTRAIRTKLEFADISENYKCGWEEVKFEGTVSRTTHYTVVQHGDNSDTLCVFAGWDDSSQSNSFHIIQIIERPTGKRDGEGRMITEPILLWSRPHRIGSVPRPRNDCAMISVDSHTMITFGGWNGRNYIDDLEVLSFSTHRARDELAALLEDPTFSQLLDVTIFLKDDMSIKLSKVVLLCRSSYFRQLLSKNPEISSIDLKHIPYNLFFPFAYYLHADVVESESIERSNLTIFLENVVRQLGAEHHTRVFQELFAAEVTSPSTLSKDLETHAWKNPQFSDVSLVVEDTVTGNTASFDVHRAIICSRSPVFRALCMGGLKESNQAVIEIPETTPELFEALLRFIYTGIVDFETVSDSIVELLLLSSRYDVSSLKSLLEGIISQSLAVDNVQSVLEIADQICAMRLKESCLKFMKMNPAS